MPTEKSPSLTAPFIARGAIAPRGLRFVAGTDKLHAVAENNWRLIMAGMEQARDERRSLYLDAPFVLMRPLRIDVPFSHAIDMRDHDDVALHWMAPNPTHGDSGTGGPVDITAPATIANLTIDMRRSSTLRRDDPSISVPQPGFAVHGSMKRGQAHALTGVTIERVTVRNGRSRAAIVIANVAQLSAGALIVENNWGAAILMSGVSDSRIDLIEGRDIGDLGTEQARYGQVAAIYAESDPGKKPASWYVIDDRNRPGLNLLPVRNLDIGRIVVDRNTDTAVYIHDYPGGTAGLGAGVGPVRIDSVKATNVGKDAVKIRMDAGPVSIGSISATGIGARGLVVEEGGHDVIIGSVSVQDLGRDVVGGMTGRPGIMNRALRGRGATLTTGAIGIDINHSGTTGTGATRNITIHQASVRNVPVRAVEHDQGWGIRIQNARGVRVDGAVSLTASSGVYISGSSDFNVDVDVVDALRVKTASVSGDYAIFVTASHNGHILFDISESSGRPRMPYAFRATADCTALDVQGSAKENAFLRPGFDRRSTVLHGVPASVRFRPLS